MFDRDDASVRTERLPNGSSFSYGMDRDGAVTAITHSTAEGEENSTRKAYTAGLLTELRSGNNIVQYRYDSKRRLQGVSLNGEDSYLTCTYSGENTDNETATVTLANGVKATSVKNLHGSITKTTIGSQSVTNTYSTTDQKLEKSVDSVAGTTSYGYNDKGSLTTVSGPGLTESYTYDDDKKTLQSKAVTAGGVTHTYQYGHRLTAAKELERITVDGKVVRPTVDVLGRNTGKTVGTTAQTLIGERISYLKYGDHATNLPGTIRYAKNVNGKMTYTDSTQYRYDCMGNIVEIMENGRTSCRYEYDALNRLTREDNTESGKTRTYSYDNNGNILAKYEYALTAKPTPELYLPDSVCTSYSYA